jgi:hypothetical protein
VLLAFPRGKQKLCISTGFPLLQKSKNPMLVLESRNIPKQLNFCKNFTNFSSMDGLALAKCCFFGVSEKIVEKTAQEFLNFTWNRQELKIRFLPITSCKWNKHYIKLLQKISRT